MAFDELAKSEDRLRTIIDTIPAIAWCTHADGSGEFWNRRWHEYTGLRLDDARGWGWETVIHPQDLEQLSKRWRSDLAAGQAGEVEGRLRRFDGEYRWFLFRYEPFRDESGKIVNWYGTDTDIEDLKRAQQELQQKERDLRTIIDAIPQGVVVLAPDGTTLYANRRALEQADLTMEEVREQGFLARAFHPEDVDRIQTDRDEKLLHHAPFGLEMRVSQKIGSRTKTGFGTKTWLCARRSTAP